MSFFRQMHAGTRDQLLRRPEDVLDYFSGATPQPTLSRPNGRINVGCGGVPPKESVPVSTAAKRIRKSKGTEAAAVSGTTEAAAASGMLVTVSPAAVEAAP